MRVVAMEGVRTGQMLDEVGLALISCWCGCEVGEKESSQGLKDVGLSNLKDRLP